jgi:hypothetical protein
VYWSEEKTIISVFFSPCALSEKYQSDAADLKFLFLFAAPFSNPKPF